MYEIVLGRSKKDFEKFGTDGAAFIGKQYVQMGRTTSLANKIYLDLVRTHVVFVCGKRGGGKSYTMGVIAEGMADLPLIIRQNLSIIFIDTMGVYWTMKYPNLKEKFLLEDWELEPHPLDIKIFVPYGRFEEYKEKGIPADYPFALKPSELQGSDWNTVFSIDPNSAAGVLIERTVHDLRERKGDDYDINDIIRMADSNLDYDNVTKSFVKNHFLNAQAWGLFSKEGTKISQLAMAGEITVLDVSIYSSEEHGWNIKSLVTGIVAQKLFLQRMEARRKEEFAQLKESMYFFSEELEVKQELPLVWLVIDEAHEFLPREGKTLASDPLVTILREGRQPGISLILASQQPGKIHTDVMTQSDIFISHRITAKVDIDALGGLMQSYLRTGLDVLLDNLPKTNGAALVLDDNNERMFPIQVRPRFTWHGGESPTAIKKEKEFFGVKL